jgi:hypothetical protein
MTEYIQGLKFMIHPRTTIREIISIKDWFGVKVGLIL